MRPQEMRASFNQVRLESVHLIFTTKFYDTGKAGELKESDVEKWERVGPREVRHFVYPKVTLSGSYGLKDYTLTCMNPHSKVARGGHIVKKGVDYEIEKIFVNCALGKAQKVPESERQMVKHLAAVLKRDIESRILTACRGVGMTQKTEAIWRKTRRKSVSASLRKFLDTYFDVLTDYDVKEAWKTIKKTRAVRAVMES